MAHSGRGLLAERHFAAFLLEQIRKREIARSHDREHVQLCSDEIACGMRRDRDAVFERMHELAAAETSS